MTNNNLIYPLSQNRIIMLKFSKISLKFFWMLIFILIFSFLTFYVFQMNQIAKWGYLIKVYEKKIENLSKENLALEINFARINSLENLEKMAEKLNFEKIQKVKYIQVLDTSLAGIR